MRKPILRWLIYTCLVGLIPVLARLFVWSVADNSVQAFSISDIVAFGLITHISTINEIQHIKNEESESWITIHSGVSIVFITIYSLILGITIYDVGPINEIKLLFNTAIMAITSFVLCLGIFFRLTLLEPSSD